jgi:[protein-PII] uridylyltransferase
VVREPAPGLSLEDLWARVRRAVSYALTDKLSLEYRLDRSATRRWPGLLARRRPLRRARDNAQSDFHTRVEVAAPDRLGLLHDLALPLRPWGARASGAHRHQRGPHT